MKIDTSPNPLDYLAAFAIAFASGVALTLSVGAYARWTQYRARNVARRAS